MNQGADAAARVAAASPARLPPREWKEVLKRTWGEAGRDNVSLVAAGVAFYGFLAFVPLLAALVLVYGLAAEPASVVQHVQRLTAVMPPDAAGLIGEQMMSMTETAAGKKGLGLFLAILLSIYGAMRGAGAIITALNVAYNVRETRSFIRTNLLAAFITVGALVSLLMAIIGTSAIAFVEHLLPFSSPFVHGVLKAGAWILAAAAVSLFIALLYRYAPDRPDADWRWLSPGSIMATLLWIGATLGFGLYVASFGNYNATYGSLGAVVVFLTWLYLSAYILLMGAELNSELEKQASCDTTAP